MTTTMQYKPRYDVSGPEGGGRTMDQSLAFSFPEMSGTITMQDLRILWEAEQMDQDDEQVVSERQRETILRELQQEDELGAGQNVLQADERTLYPGHAWLHSVPNNELRNTLKTLSRDRFRCAVCGVQTTTLDSLGQWSCRMEIDYSPWLYAGFHDPDPDAYDGRKPIRLAVRADHRPPDIASWREKGSVVVLPKDVLLLWPRRSRPLAEAMHTTHNVWRTSESDVVVTSGSTSIMRYDAKTSQEVQTTFSSVADTKTQKQILHAKYVAQKIYRPHARLMYIPKDAA
jgi:hypothetical protein